MTTYDGEKNINIFLVIVFLTQILPVQQISEIVFGNQLNKAATQDIDNAVKENFKGDNKCEFLARIHEGIKQYFTMFSQSITKINIIFPYNHSTDILTPPPNC